MSKKQQYVVIEKTSKSVKAKSATGTFLVVVGVVLCFTPLLPLGIILWLIGGLIYNLAKLEKWWYHD